jgi:hypothetical protein
MDCLGPLADKLRLVLTCYNEFRTVILHTCAGLHIGHDWRVL